MLPIFSGAFYLSLLLTLGLVTRAGYRNRSSHYTGTHLRSWRLRADYCPGQQTDQCDTHEPNDIHGRSSRILILHNDRRNNHSHKIYDFDHRVESGTSRILEGIADRVADHASFV